MDNLPPIGNEPRFNHDDHRLYRIKIAISRMLYSLEGVPVEWIEEYNELITRRTSK